MSDFQHSNPAWPAVERRAPPPLPPHAGSTGAGDPVTKEYLDHALAEWRHASREYFNTRFVHLEDMIKDGFPEGDPRSHREVHETYIRQAKSRRDMWDAVLKQVLSGTVWAGILAISAALWIQFKAEIRK